MQNCIDVFSYFAKGLDKICEEKNCDKLTRRVLQGWLLSIAAYYEPSNDILNHFNIEKYLEYNFEKLRQTKDIKVLGINEILNDSKSRLYRYIQKIPFNSSELSPRISKNDDHYILDENGEYYLSALGVCCGGKRIELLAETGIEYTLQHELQHINQNYVYPSELPFSYDMLKMLKEGEADYHYYLLNSRSRFYPINKADSYHIYYLIYTLLMFVIPKEMRESWNKVDSFNTITVCSDTFKYISDSEINRNNFSDIFALITLIVALCNPENTPEIFENSISISFDRCSKKVDGFNQIIQCFLDDDREKNQRNMEYQKKLIELLQNPSLLQEKYLEMINEEKEFITTEPKENQEKLLQELNLFSYQDFESKLKEELKEIKEELNEREELAQENQKKSTTQEILGTRDYQQYCYYQFGIELNKKMQILLKPDLNIIELFEQLLEKISNYLIENQSFRLEEKLDFIEEIRNKCLERSKMI